MKKLKSITSFSIIFITLTLITNNFLQAQSLEEAHELFKSAQNFEEMLVSAQAFEKNSEQNLDDWKAAYWASFTYSQAGRLSNEKKKYYQEAFKFLDRTKKNISSDKVDIFVYTKALEALLYSLSQGPEFASGNSAKGLHYISLQKKALNDGLKVDQNNPLLMVLIGTGMIGEAMRNRNDLDRSKLITGKILLEKAQSIYNKMPESDELIPDRWNKGWINVWMNRVDQALN